jgi:hypothetical protein
MCLDRRVAAAVRMRRVERAQRLPWPNPPVRRSTTPSAAVPRSPRSKWPQLGAGRSPASLRTRRPSSDEGCPGALLRPKQVSCSRRHRDRRLRGVPRWPRYCDWEFVLSAARPSGAWLGPCTSGLICASIHFKGPERARLTPRLAVRILFWPRSHGHRQVAQRARVPARPVRADGRWPQRIRPSRAADRSKSS